MKKPKPRRGRPPGSGAKGEEKFVGWQVRFPPEELAEFQRLVPTGERAEFARQAIKRALRRLKEQGSDGP